MSKVTLTPARRPSAFCPGCRMEIPEWVDVCWRCGSKQEKTGEGEELRAATTGDEAERRRCRYPGCAKVATSFCTDCGLQICDSHRVVRHSSESTLVQCPTCRSALRRENALVLATIGLLIGGIVWGVVFLALNSILLAAPGGAAVLLGFSLIIVIARNQANKAKASAAQEPAQQAEPEDATPASPGTRICPHCGAENKEWLSICSSCNGDLNAKPNKEEQLSIGQVVKGLVDLIFKFGSWFS